MLRGEHVCSLLLLRMLLRHVVVCLVKRAGAGVVSIDVARGNDGGCSRNILPLVHVLLKMRI